MRKYTYYCDPGHGWLKVPKKEVEEIGILDMISSYSYQRVSKKGEVFLYLEEDRDAPLFIEALKSRGHDVTTVEKYSERPSKIRSYDRMK